jgi:putative oxidoreductase
MVDNGLASEVLEQWGGECKSNAQTANRDKEVADQFIKSNDRLRSFELLEIELVELTMNSKYRLPLVLLVLRLSVFAVMFIWTIDKFVEPQHASRVMAEFYSIGGIGNAVVYVLAVLELAILLAFLFGFAKRWSYGLVLLLHAASTIFSYKKYLAPFQPPNLLFFAAIPMLAACFALYYVRDADVLWTVERKQG